MRLSLIHPIPQPRKEITRVDPQIADIIATFLNYQNRYARGAYRFAHRVKIVFLQFSDACGISTSCIETKRNNSA